MPRLIPYEDTGVSVIKSIAEIEELLVVHHATNTMKQYESGRITGMGFWVEGHPYQLPSKAVAVYNYLLKKKKDSPVWRVSSSASTPEGQRLIYEQAERVAWRNVNAWVKAQLAMVEIGMVQVAEVFMPYMLVSPTETIYQRLSAGKEIPALMEAKP